MQKNIRHGLMVKSGRILSEILNRVEEFISPGMSAKDVDDFVGMLITKAAAVPAFLGYRGFPANSCICVNEEIVHGIPSAERILCEGDLVTVDIGVDYRGHFTDAARTVVVGGGTHELVDSAYRALGSAASVIKAGISTGTIGHTIHSSIENDGFDPVIMFGGHGIGLSIHLPPFIPNYGSKGAGETLKAGVYIAVEPVITECRTTVGTRGDGWTVYSVEGCLSAHVENTYYVTENGIENLTGSV